MANVFVSLNRGEEGFKNSDFTTGSSSASSDDIELRFADDKGITRKDLVKALEAFRRWFENPQNTDVPIL
jgi:hypothetical protein